MLIVKRRVFAPILAEAQAASLPACPPPITMTSKLSVGINILPLFSLSHKLIYLIKIINQRKLEKINLL